MNVVGIDVSKGKSTVAVMRPFGEVIMSPIDVFHTAEGLMNLAMQIKALDGETRVVMEYTSKYYRPVANFLRKEGIFVCVANALLVHNYCGQSLRRAKTDRIDAVKIANYGIDHWLRLREYTPEEEARELLKVYSRQLENYTKMQVALQNSLQSLLDQTFPGVRTLFHHSGREDGREKWVDFAAKFWHCEKVSKLSTAKFTESFNNWCRKAGYRPNSKKAEEIYALSKQCISTLPCSKDTETLVQTAANQASSLLETAKTMQKQMKSLAEQLPEYEVVREFYGIGDSLATRIIAEIGDVRRFYKKGALVAFAGLDAPPYQSGDYSAKNRHISKRGSPLLRKALFEFTRVLLIKAPQDNVIYEYIQKKRGEGKPYKVALMAGAGKFLKIYYARAKERLETIAVE